MQIRDFTKPFELTDLTEELMIVPNTWGLVNELGVFTNDPVSQDTITFEERESTLGLITDKVRGERNNVNKDDTRRIRSYALPHFPLDDAISPNDVKGKRAYGSDSMAETIDAVMQRKMERIRRNHAVTLEYARCIALTTGGIYAPNGTVVGNYYTDFGITRKEVAFDLAGTGDVVAKGEEMIAHIQDNILTGDVVSSIVALCSPTFFSALIANAGVKDAYKFYSSSQEPNRNRVGSGLYRTFDHGGVRYIEYRGNYLGQALIPAGDAYFMPMGTEDMFFTHFGPANKFSSINTLGEETYMWAYRDQKDSKIEIESESNFLNLIRRPQAVTRAVLGASV